MVDLSVSPAIQYLSGMLLDLKETAGEIIGVPRQRVGGTVASDQVGTYEKSLERAMIVTEILYYDSDEVLANALTQLLRIGINYSYKDGGVFQYVSADFKTEILNIPKGLLDDIDFDVFALNNNEDAKALRDLKDILTVGYKSGQIDYNTLINLSNVESVHEMESKLKYFSEKAAKIAQKNQQAEWDNEKQKEQEALAFQQEFDAYWKKAENDLETLKLQLDEKTGEINADLDRQKLALVDKEIEVNKVLKLIELANEKESEDNAVSANREGTAISAKVQTLGIQVNAMLAADKNEKDDKANKEKIKVEKVKAKKTTKEHVSDK